MTGKRRPTVGLGIRIDHELHQRLVSAADEREVSVNWLVKRAIVDYLNRLIPVDEMKWTREL